MEFQTNSLLTTQRLTSKSALFSYEVEVVKEGTTLKKVSVPRITKVPIGETVDTEFYGSMSVENGFRVITLSDKLTVEEQKTVVAEFDQIILEVGQ